MPRTETLHSKKAI